jgi:hypothetical protein
LQGVSFSMAERMPTVRIYPAYSNLRFSGGHRRNA